MKKKTLTWLLFFCPLALFGQEIDLFALLTSCIEDNAIVVDKEQYKKVVIDVPPEDLFSFTGEGDEPNVKQTVTYYIDGDEIILITVSSECDRFWFVERELIEYNLKNDTVFLVYQHYQVDHYTVVDDFVEVTATRITEKRTYYDSNRPIRCLTKEVEGKPSEIDLLFQKAEKKEEDCTSVWRIGESSISAFYDIDIESFLGFYRKYGAQAAEEEKTEKKTTKLYWINAETGEVIGTVTPYQKVRLGFETQGYQKGEEVKALIQCKNGEKIDDNKTELIYTGIVDENGRAVSKETLYLDVANRVKSE